MIHKLISWKLHEVGFLYPNLEKGSMKWVVDAQGNYYSIEFLFRDHSDWFIGSSIERSQINQSNPEFQEFLSTLKTPCCKSGVSVVWSRTGLKKPYFRHIKLEGCPYALNSEYLSDIHWEIVDFMEDLFRLPHNFSQIRKFRGLKLREKLKLALGKGKFLREIIMRAFGHEKRTDIIYKGYAIEVQCSPISEQEVKLREKVYSKFGLKTLWILGFPESAQNRVHLTIPDEIDLRKKIEMKKYQFKYQPFFKKIYFKHEFGEIYNQNTEYEQFKSGTHDDTLQNNDAKITPDKKPQKKTIDEILHSESNMDLQTRNNNDVETSLMFKGLKIEKWRVWLLEHSTVIGIYYKGRLHFDFDIFPWYFELPVQLKYPYRKEFLLALRTAELHSILTE